MNITKLLAIAGLAAVYAVLILAGTTITIVTGIPGAGGIINAVIGGALLAFCCLLIKRFGAATLMGFIYSIIVLPLPALGPPGFVVKLLIGGSVGFISDAIYLLLKKSEILAALFIGGVSSILVGLEIAGLGILFSVPGAEQLAKILLMPLMIPGSILLGVVGGYIGYKVYKTMEKTAIIKKIQG